MSLLQNSPPAGFETPEPPPGFGTPEQIYARALDLGYGPSRRVQSLQRVGQFAYWAAVILAIGWMFAMALDRDFPITMTKREVLNTDKKVMLGDRLRVRVSRMRSRSCPLVRRWTVIDGEGRRFDYEPEVFEAYGAVTPKGSPPDIEIIGPVIPLDARPGRGRWVSVLSWECNMLQRAISWPIVMIQPPVEFEIVARAMP